MARQYSLRSFFRHVPNSLLRIYFERFSLEEDLDWEHLDETDAEPLFAAFLSADPSTQGRIVQDSRAIDDLAGEAGILALIRNAEEHCPDLDLATHLSRMNSCHEMSFWVFLHHPAIFRLAGVIDGREDVTSIKLGGFHPLQCPPDGESSDRLGRAISAYYMSREGRGRRWDVDYYSWDDNHCWVISLEGFPDSSIVYDHGDNLGLETHRPVFEVAFHYRESERSLEVLGVDGIRTVSDVRTIFARAILGSSFRPDSNAVTYDLSPLRSRDFDLTVKPEYGIKEARLRELRFTALGRQDVAITIEAGSSNCKERIYDLLEDVLAVREVPNELVIISMARFELTFYPDEAGGKDTTLYFWVSQPHSTSLRFGGLNNIARLCLRDWGIDASASAEGGAAAPACESKCSTALR